MANYMTQALLKIKLQDNLHELITKSNSSLVTMADGKTLETKISELVTTMTDITKSGGNIDTAVTTACDNLKKEIMGYTEGDEINQALDTIKEIAAWIGEHPDNSTAAQLVTDVAALQTAVGSNEKDAETGIYALIADLASKVGTLESKSTAVEASETNGNIKVDGQEVTVYTHPETHSADMITDGENNKVLTNERKAEYEGKAKVYVNQADNTSVPETMKEGDILIQIISSAQAD